MNPPAARSSARTGLWRAAFVIYAMALTTGTHWPKLQVHSPVPSSDKIIHFLAFGGLTVLLWQTRWIRSLWLLLIVAAVWTALDEWSQNIPVLKRTATPIDVLAGVAGVLAAVLFIAVLKRWRRNSV
jgi:hypothetical protein